MNQALVQQQKQQHFAAYKKPLSIGQGSKVRGIIQAKLKIGAPNDKYEQEADRVAEQVMRMPDRQKSTLPENSSQINNTFSHSQKIQRICTSCLEDEELIQKKTTENKTPEAISVINSEIKSLQSAGKPLSKQEHHFFESRFGSDFSNVRVHDNTHAACIAESVNARAFTLGQNIVFGAGEYAPDSFAGKKLLAHELTHVIQQGADSLSSKSGTDLSERLQRETLEGTEDMCIDYAGRDLRTGDSSSPLPETSSPGGTILPGTEGRGQNCAGVSLCNRTEWVNWPHLGREASDGKVYGRNFVGNWDQARYFVPSGCTFVNSSGVGVNATRCYPSEREIMVFLYRWPVGVIRGSGATVYQSDFHMIGRDCSVLPRAWESKMDQRERVEDIRNPWQSLYDAYPHTRNPDREIVQLTFCCDCDQVATG